MTRKLTRSYPLSVVAPLIAILIVLTAHASTAPLFAPAVSYGSGGNLPFSVVVGDVNGDGKPDLLVANDSGNDGSGSVGVLLGNGDGTFQSAVSYDSGGSVAYSVAVGDVNGDGKQDLLVANYLSGTVGVLLGNGDGTFQPAVTYNSGGSSPIRVALADVNGDGKPDLLVTNYLSDTVGVLLGNGDGTFQSAVTYNSGASLPDSVAVADVNGDSKPDLVVGGYSVGVLLGNGDGTFQPAVVYPSRGYFVSSVVVADVNADGKPDVVVANCAPSGSANCFSGKGLVGVLLGNGDGTFQTAVNYPSGGYNARSLAVTDVDGDGTLDVVVANECLNASCNFGPGALGVLLGKGGGTFKSAVSYSTGGDASDSIAVADVNGDGKADVVVANNGSSTLGVLLNISPRTKYATSMALVSGLNPSTYGQKVTWTATVTSSGSVTPTGKVNFTWSGNTIGSATLNSSGVAAFSRSSLNADTFPLTAVYAGDANNLGSTSAVLNQVVLQATSSATLTSSPNPSTQGQAVTFTATISSPTVTPTGPVTFTAGKTVLGTAQLGGGKAKLTISSLAVGSTAVTATYYGDSNIAKSSASVIQTVR
jgi:hypothetical protein